MCACNFENPNNKKEKKEKKRNINNKLIIFKAEDEKMHRFRTIKIPVRGRNTFHLCLHPEKNVQAGRYA